MSTGERAAAMAARLDRTARRLGLGEQDRDRLVRAFRSALEPRAPRIADEHHPDWLHPARTALILMDDAGVADPDTLIAALLLETRRAALRVGEQERDGFGPAVAAILEEVPAEGGDDRRLERLVLLSPPAGLVALAERLDHARHLHLRDRGEWHDYHRLTCAAYRPFAARVHPVLARRFHHWCRAFSDRFLAPRDPA